ncbi:MAG: enoyl-CoA hydratase-related protein [Bacteroidales bacterium]|nr:enoyl-CoA hydratase-related protein [Bacteroidales bacterium]
MHNMSGQEFKDIIVEIDHTIARVWINRPHKRNALTGKIFKELLKTFKMLHNNRQIRLVVLRGKDNVLSAGADIEWMQQTGREGFIKNVLQSKLIADCLYHFFSLPQITMVVVEKNAFGGILGFIAAADIAISEQDAILCFPEVRLGIAPAAIMPYVMHKTKGLHLNPWIYSGRTFTARQALGSGLIDMIVPNSELEKNINELCESIDKVSSHALRATKRLVGLFRPPITFRIKTYTYLLLARLRRSRHGQEGLKAFLEKREPRWEN